jgi:hypothetical protein
MQKSVEYILDAMRESGFSIPNYVGTKQASGVAWDNPSGISMDSQENVWLSAIKLACSDLPAVRASYQKQVTDAARRYGILEDIKAASAFIVEMDSTSKKIRTEFDWKQTKEWLTKNANYLNLPLREGIVDHLFEKAAEMNYVPSLSERCALLQLAQRDPLISEVQKLAEESVHKLASGTHYTTEQFGALPFEEVQELLPDLVKRASFEMPLLHPRLFAKSAETADANTAVVLDALLQKHGQTPLHDESNLPVEVSDAILARL